MKDSTLKAIEKPYFVNSFIFLNFNLRLNKANMAKIVDDGSGTLKRKSVLQYNKGAASFTSLMNHTTPFAQHFRG